MSDQKTIARSSSTHESQIPQIHGTDSRGLLASPPSRSWTGRSLGKYIIGELIGRGGNGEVYHATHQWLDRSVAIKFLIGIRADDHESAERFRREAQVAASMIHPNIVRATDGGIVADQLFLVTDLVDGFDLSELIQRHHRLSVADVCEIGFQAATALGFVASYNTVHRDVKPSNLMLDRDGTVKLLDLGLARTMDGGHTMTATGQVLGTIDYLAPEQATDPRRVDHRADVYSLGCTLYYLLAGKAPFSTDHLDTLTAKLLATIETDPTPIRKVRRDVPAKLAALIESMLDKEPGRRPATFQTIAQSLKPFAADADLMALVSIDGKPATYSKQPHTPMSLQVGDLMRVSSKATVRLCLRGLGFLEPVPLQRAGQRQTYRFSFRWLKLVTAISLFAVLLWVMRFPPRRHGPVIAPVMHPHHRTIPGHDYGVSDAELRYNSLFGG
tara:strand:- start:62213 stop:63541 length:1329 start_codon:yes stop_codon:yes gene_type:complete